MVAAVALTSMIAPAAAPAEAPRMGEPIAGTQGELAGSGGYPRVIRLAHSGEANGTFIETDTDGFIGGVQRFHRSSDGGRTFTALPQLQVEGVIHGTTLLELPAAAGDQSAGTLLFSMAVNPSGEYPPDAVDNEMTIPVYRSTDQGASWELLSYCARTDDGGQTGGLWEPNLHVANDGSLVCLYSDETDRPAHSQVLTQVVSHDGGATWSPPQQVVATPDPIDRPGMPTTARLGDGSWVMTYEDCGLRHAPCLVLIRRSPDGLDWGDPASDGALVTSTDGGRLISAPTVAWTPAGGPDGTVLVIGRIYNGADGLADPASGRVVLASTARGDGPWTAIGAPVPVDDAAWENTPVNYSSPLLPLGGDLVMGFAVDQADDADLVVRWGITPMRPLPPPPTSVPPTTTPAASPAAPVPAAASFTG